MSDSAKTPAKKTQLEYPESTDGSRIARENREKANTLSEEEREAHLKRGMQIVYGGSPARKPARSR